MATINIAQTFTDKRIFASALGDPASWRLWLTILCAAFALPLDAAQLETFAVISGGRQPPTKIVRELWVLAGRRSGKSRIAALVAIYIALFVKHRPAIGERPIVLVIAGSIDQSATVFGYVKGFLEASPVLRKEVANVKRHEIELKNGVIIAVHSNSFRTVRGRTLVACIMDEVSFWKDETSATPDVEMYRAVLPSMATTSGMLIGISTPYRRMGLMFQKHRDYFAHDDNEVLVVQGASKLFNPSLSDETIALQRAADPTAAISEWDAAAFRDDLRGFLDDERIDSAIEYGRPLELPPRPYPMHYEAFTDASGGAGLDAYSIAVGHRERIQGSGHDYYIIDAVRGTSGKFDPAEITKQYAALLKEYRITSVSGDRYSAEWVQGAWRRENIN